MLHAAQAVRPMGLSARGYGSPNKGPGRSTAAATGAFTRRRSNLLPQATKGPKGCKGDANSEGVPAEPVDAVPVEPLEAAAGEVIFTAAQLAGAAADAASDATDVAAATQRAAADVQSQVEQQTADAASDAADVAAAAQRAAVDVQSQVEQQVADAASDAADVAAAAQRAAADVQRQVEQQVADAASDVADVAAAGFHAAADVQQQAADVVASTAQAVADTASILAGEAPGAPADKSARSMQGQLQAPKPPAGALNAPQPPAGKLQSAAEPVAALPPPPPAASTSGAGSNGPSSSASSGRGNGSGAAERADEIAALKHQLISMLASLDRGAAATEDQAQRVDNLCKRLELLGGAVLLSWEKPASGGKSGMALLDGRWRLLYSSGFTSGSLGGRRPGPSFGSLPLTLGPVYQDLYTDKSELDNVVDLFLRFSLASLPGVPAGVPSATARLRHTYEIIGGNTVEITFEDTEVRLAGGLQGWLDSLPTFTTPKLPDWLQPPRNMRAARFDVVFLDEGLRITRGDRGELRIFSKGAV